jgi:hypothetical protein
MPKHGSAGKAVNFYAIKRGFDARYLDLLLKELQAAS